MSWIRNHASTCEYCAPVFHSITGGVRSPLSIAQRGRLRNLVRDCTGAKHI